jgi:acetate---CoA ligase (ADP-forming)
MKTVKSESSREKASGGFSVLMHAKSVAVIGASHGADIQLKLTSRPLKFLQKFGFRGRVVGVNPKYTELDGVPCYPSIIDVPGEVDVAVIFLPKARITPAVEECGKKGVKALIIFSSGYGEAGEQGARDQRDLVALAHRYGMRIVGPNASAVVNMTNGLAMTFLTAFMADKVERGNIAFASNSGALLSTAIKLTEEKGSAFSLLMANGNEADLTLSDFLSFAVEDENTKVIAAFVESVKDGPALIAGARRAIDTGKTVVAVKVGSSARWPPRIRERSPATTRPTPPLSASSASSARATSPSWSISPVYFPATSRPLRPQLP